MINQLELWNEVEAPPEKGTPVPDFPSVPDDDDNDNDEEDEDE